MKTYCLLFVSTTILLSAAQAHAETHAQIQQETTKESQPLERLFFTAAERVQMNKERAKTQTPISPIEQGKITKQGKTLENWASGKATENNIGTGKITKNATHKKRDIPLNEN